MSGEAPPLLPTFDFQNPTGRGVNGNQRITGMQSPSAYEPPQEPGARNQQPVGMRPGERLQWLLDQTTRATQARDAMLGNPPQDPKTMTVAAMSRIMEAAQDPEHGPAFVDWLGGKQQERFREAYDTALAETGDTVAAMRTAQSKEGYSPPISTLESDPELAKFDYQTVAAANSLAKSKFEDWVLQPAVRLATGIGQGGADLAIGAVNIPLSLFGTSLPHKDVKDTLSAAFQSMTGGDNFREAEKEAAFRNAVYENERDWVGRVLQGGASVTGQIASLAGGPAKWLFAGAGKAGAAAGSLVPNAKLAKAIELATKGAAGFGALDFVTAQGEGGKAPSLVDRLKAGGLGAALGPLFEGAMSIGRVAYRSYMARAMQKAAGKLGDPGAEKATKVMTDWAEANHVAPRSPGETPEDYTRRLIGDYVDAGMPGANLTGARIVATGAQGLVDALGMSAVDLDFGKDVAAAIFNRDGEALKRAGEKLLGTALGLAFVHYGGSFEKLKYELRRAGLQRPEQAAEQPTEKTAEQPAVRQETGDLARYGWAEEQELKGEVERAEGEGMPAREEPETAAPAAQEPSKRRRMVYQGSPYAYEIEGNKAFPNDRMRQALKLPEEMPLSTFERKIKKASVLSALQSKALLPGDEITPNGWIAEPAKAGEQSGTVRTVRFGEVVERSLAPDGKWHPAETVETRKRDLIPPEQEVVVEAISKVAQRKDLDPEDKAVLGGVKDVLESVSMHSDRAVAETVAAMHQGALVPELQGDPETAGRAIEGIGEMLTTKAPEVVMSEQQAPATEQPKQEEPKTEQLQQRLQQVRERIGSLSREIGERKANIELRSARAAEGRGVVFGNQKETLVKLMREMGGAEHERTILESEIAKRESESGAALTDLLTLPVDAAIKAVGYLADNPLTRLLSEDHVSRISRLVDKQTGDKFRDVVARQHHYVNELQPTIRDLGKVARYKQPDLHDAKVTDTMASGGEMIFDGMQVGRETSVQNRYGLDRRNLDADANRVLKLVDDAYEQTREIANDLGFEMSNVFDAQGNRAKVRAKTDKLALARQVTRDGQAAMENPEFIADLAELNGSTPDAMAKALEEAGYTTPRTLRKLDAIESRRGIEFLPAYWRSASTGKKVRILETRPIEHTERLVRAFGMRAGLHEVFGPDRTSPAGALQQYQPYADVVATGKTRAAKSALAKGFLAASGMQDSDMSPGAEKVADFLRPLMSLYTAGKLTGVRSIAQNLTEPWGQGAALLGVGRVTKAAGEVLQAFSTGKLPAMIADLTDEGGWTPMVHSNTPEGVGETVNLVARKGMIPFDLTQGWADVVNRVAVGKMVEDMEAGNGGLQGQTFARALDYSVQDAQRLASGGGTPEEYDALMQRAMPRLTGRGQLPLEESAAGAGFRKSFVPFMRYALKFQQNVQRLGRAMREAQTPEEKGKSVLAMTQFLLGTAASGVAGQLVGTWATKGWDEMSGQVSEMLEHPVASLALGFVSQMLGGPGASIAVGASGIFSGSKDQKLDAYERALGVFAPVAAAFEFGHFISGSGSYSGKGPAGRIWTYMQRTATGLRDIDRGLGGFAAIAVTTDPQVADAGSKLKRWKEKTGIDDGQHPEPTEFSNAMRGFELELREPNAIGNVDLHELAQRIVAARPTDGEKPKSDLEWRQSAHKSLLDRRMFNPDWYSKTTIDQKADLDGFMGEDKLATAHGYDAALTRLAELVYPDYLRPGRRQRERR